MKITYEKWGTHEGRDVYLFTLMNKAGALVQVSNYAATLVAVQLEDHAHMILGFNNLQAYLEDRCYIGSTVGRVANRIGNARFELDGQSYDLQQNDGVNNNHSASAGMHKKIFGFEVTDTALILQCSSPDGEGGFPGEVQLTVRYQWSADNQLTIDYAAISDKPTIVNITNHAYFNLSGTDHPVMDHVLYIPAGQLLEASADYIPTGNKIPVGAKSFLTPQLLQAQLNDYYVLDNDRTSLKLAATLEHPASAHKLDVYTTYPGLMVYSADYLASEANGLLQKPYAVFGGVCLECQHYPDAPNHSGFPSITLTPGMRYGEQIIYHFKKT